MAFVRVPIFWLVVVGSVYVQSIWVPASDWRHVAAVLGEVANHRFEQLSEPRFAFALASGIFQFAFGLAAAFLLCHVALIGWAIGRARIVVGNADRKRFAGDFDRVSARLERNPLVGAIWKVFYDTTFVRDGIVHSTARPQAFINAADARERYFGLKMMPAIPGFFVGTGLLLTFVGLLLALNKAAGATDATNAGGMVDSLNGLLKAATFKFATSIAGLGASLLLSLVFRSYQIWIDRFYFAFCHTLEERMLFHPSQRSALETLDVLREQRDELKEINSDRFFTRLGTSVAGSIESAVGSAMHPVAQRLDAAIAQVTDNSRTGIDDLLGRFTETLRGGAGAEIGEMARTLGETRGALEAIRNDLSGTGADFARRMSDAADGLARVVEQAGRELGGSAAGAAGSFETAMAGVAERMQSQMTGFGEALAAFQAATAERAEADARRVQEAGEAAAAATRKAASDAAAASAEAARETVETIRSGVADVIGSLREDITRLSDTLRSVASAFANQTQQIDGVAGRSREAADAFGRVASDVRSAAQPLLTQGETIAAASERIATAVSTSSQSLAGTNEAARALADALHGHFEQVARVWEDYAQRFAGVDADLERAAERFRADAEAHQESIRSFVVDVDGHTKRIVDKLAGSTERLGETLDALHETLDDFLARVSPRDAAE